MPDVLMGALLGMAGLHGQHLLGAVSAPESGTLCATRRCITVEVRGLHPDLSQQAGEAEGSPCRETPVRAGESPRVWWRLSFQEG